MPTDRYRLVDPRPIALEAPYTYFLPSQAELAAVGTGDHAKLIFELVPPGEEFDAERMWVLVTAVEGDFLEGTLDNKPHEAAMELGELVRFQRHHVIGIDWKDPASAPTPTEHREYWERCMVDSCVLFDGVSVEYLYREPPCFEQEGDKYPDSGWRIRGRRGDATDEEMDARDADYVAIGAVLNRDDSWIHLIDAPTGSAFTRDFTTREYVAVQRD